MYACRQSCNERRQRPRRGLASKTLDAPVDVPHGPAVEEVRCAPCLFHGRGESKKSVSANPLKRTLDVSYKTAWYLCDRIRAAMKDEGAAYLTGILEAGGNYAGGKLGGSRPGRKASVPEGLLRVASWLRSRVRPLLAPFLVPSPGRIPGNRRT